jgi:hypothetical protein
MPGLRVGEGVRVDVATNPADIADFATLYHTVVDGTGLVIPGCAAQWGAQAFPPPEFEGQNKKPALYLSLSALSYISHFISMMRPRTWWGGSARMTSSVLVIAFTND